MATYPLPESIVAGKKSEGGTGDEIPHSEQIHRKLNALYLDAKADFGAVGDNSTDDTDRIQEALDEAHAAGGGTVTCPKGRYVFSQLEMGHFTRLRGTSRLSYGFSGATGNTVLKQAAGVDADAVIFKTPSATFLEPFAITDLVLMGNPANTSGHGIHTVNSAGAQFKIQDMTTLERLTLRRFAGDGLRIHGGSPINIRHIVTLFNGGYGVSLIEDSVNDFEDVHQVTLYDITGDGNSGGASLLLSGLTEDSLVTIIGLKTEQRNNTDRGGALANQNCIHAVNCAGRIDIHGLFHLGNGTLTTKPGDLVRVTGTGVPTISWSGINVRALAAQTVGDDPVFIDDQVTPGEVEITKPSGVYPPQQILAVGASATVDDVITALQNLGLVKQS